MRAFFDRQAGELKATAQSVEDLWYLHKIITPKSVVEGRGWRRFKSKASGEEGARADSGEKKPVHLEIEVSSVEFAESANKLRITGKILRGTPEEFVQAGEHHTLDVEPRDQITIRKEFSPYDAELIAEAKKTSRHVRAAIVAIDERHATVSALRTSGVSVLFEAANPASKREPKTFEEQKKGFYNELGGQLESVEADFFIIAGPGFAAAEFKKYLDEKFPAVAKKCKVEHASTSERTATVELLKRGALEALLGEQKLQEEFSALEKLKESLGKEDGLSAYGLKEVADAVEQGACGHLLILDELLRKEKKADGILSSAKKLGAKITVFNSDDDAGREFKAFQIAALLRYKKY